MLHIVHLKICNVRSSGTVRAKAKKTKVYAMLVDKFGTLYSDAYKLKYSWWYYYGYKSI